MLLVDASRLQVGERLILQREPTDLAGLAARTVEAWRVAAPNHRIELELDGGELIGSWDRSRLARVVDNLLANAVRYSQPGTRVRVRLRREPASAAGAEPQAQAMAVVEVEDEGLGIPPADLPHIFEWFRRGSNVEQIAGTGIGLAGAAEIVAQHGGTLSVQSEEGRGSTFTLQLPIEPPDATV